MRIAQTEPGRRSPNVWFCGRQAVGVDVRAVTFRPHDPSLAIIGSSRINERFGKPFDIETTICVRGWCEVRVEFRRR